MTRSIIILSCLLLIGYMPADAQATSNTFLNLHTLRNDKGGVKAARQFMKLAGENKEERWYMLPGGYLAEFEERTIHNKLVFDRNGNWLYTMREYSEKELPGEVRRLVKSTYYDFSIGWVKEVSQFRSLAYVVHIQNAPEWKDLIVRDGEIEVVRSYEQ
ncbi:hypothetical protein Q4E93_01325 [Flavitalea sp. BT771]|uniref:hypothetical protein n=1 Tax=Flavitalea sp. BT771 TaxID=3063329 RepID=UPI0026E1E347|nr:hypothetical protein [Flavitalea sp. BT771]MDO6429208.1 hypothetical protein [Flavitalea sp. BT771]MDV6218664.1 hypothetical protein [Flavitalea sp. BT771]